jgi:hypothetical protein
VRKVFVNFTLADHQNKSEIPLLLNIPFPTQFNLSCDGGEKTLVVDLPNIELGKGFFGNNAAELRGLALHLDKQGTKEQYRMEGVDYSEPPKYVPNPNDLKWEDAHVECWTKDNQCDWLMKN